MNLVRIAAQARTLWERLGDIAPAPIESIENGVGVELFDLWCHRLTRGNRETFARRLSWDGLSAAHVAAVARANAWPRERPAPGWVRTLQEASTEAAATKEMTVVEPVPFAALLMPFVTVARRRLRTSAGALCERCYSEAHAALDRQLLSSLAEIAAPTLFACFSFMAAQERWTIASGAGSAASTAGYLRFVERSLADGMTSICEEYPVLARRLATMVDHWVDAGVEFLERLDGDTAALAATFGTDGEADRVVELRPGLSDPHHGRRTVFGLTFLSGRRLLYKPKDLALDEAFEALLDWLGRNGAPLDLRGVRVLNRGEYGWTEHIDHLDSPFDGVGRYYQRAGMLLCLAYVLEATDCSQDNLIAHGEHPVLIDLETLLHPRIAQAGGGLDRTAQEMAFEAWDHSVLRTAMLPMWEVRLGAAAMVIDRAGLGGARDAETIPGRRWVNVNTDAMRMVTSQVPLPHRENVPTCNGAKFDASHHVADIVHGFTSMYRLLIERREALLAPGGPLSAFAAQRVRFVHRPTDVYYGLLAQLADPVAMTSGIEQSLRLELLGRAFLTASNRPALWDLVAAEQTALERGDIPMFLTRASSDGIDVAPGRHAAGVCESSPFSAVLECMARLNDDDLARQVAFIEGSFYTYMARDAGAAAAAHAARPSRAASAASDARGASSASADDAPASVASPDALIERAVRIAGEIDRLAIRSADGSAAWIAPQYHASSERYLLRPLEHDLYAGASGVALFLAAVERVTGDTGFRGLALGALQPLRRQLRETSALRHLPPGAGAGLGSIVYALVTAGHLLDEPALYDDAACVARMITAERLEAEPSPDVLIGSAGAIFGLDALYAATGDREWIERAAACGRRVLALQDGAHDSRGVHDRHGASDGLGPSGPDGARAWRTYRGKRLTGLSHGAAGISYALTRLSALAGDATFEAAARDGLEYERRVFSAAEQNWPDFRQDTPTYAVRWCHGAPGIALARIGSLATIDDDAIRGEIDVALLTTAGAAGDAGPESLDHVCCGVMGCVETLLVAARHLDRPGLVSTASHLTARVLGRAGEANAFSLHPLLPRTVPNPTFFQGIAGIGYTLLRLVAPERLPSVLMWERPIRSSNEG